MKKLLPIVLVIGALVVVILVFAGRGARQTPSGGSSPTSTSDTSAGSSGTSETFTGKLKDAIAMGVAMKCSYQVEGNQYEGYIKGENYRGQIKTADGKTGGVIIKDDCMWTWSEDETQGVKTCFEETEMEEGTEETDIWEQPQGTAGSDVTYTCVPAVVTDAQFTPPANINFMDLSEMMEGFGYQ